MLWYIPHCAINENWFFSDRLGSFMILDGRDIGMPEQGGDFAPLPGVKEPVGLYEEFVCEVANAVCDRLWPELNRIANHSGVGVLKGKRAIARYMGLSIPEDRPGYVKRTSGSFGYNVTIDRWYRNKGFPLCKSPDGRWWTTKTQIDTWMYERGMLMRKAVEVKMGLPHKTGRGGYYYTAPPERYSREQRDELTRLVLKDRVMASLGRESLAGEEKDG